MNHHLHRIRQSSHKTKFRWLVGLSSAATIIIVLLWILYMRAFIFTDSRNGSTEDVSINFWPVFKNALTITGSSISRTANDILSDMPAVGRRTTTIQNPE